MERFYDGDQEKLFSEAHVMNPFAKAPAKVVKKDVRRTGPSVEECEVRKFTIHSEFRVCSLCFFFCRYVYLCSHLQLCLGLNVVIASAFLAGQSI